MAETKTKGKTPDPKVDVAARQSEIDDEVRRLLAEKRDLAIETGVVDRSLFQPWQGPFPEYTIVTTPFGEHAVPAFKILWFTVGQRVNRKTMQIEDYAIPNYRDATDSELEAFDLLDAKDYLLPINDRRRPPPKGEGVDAKDLGFAPSPAGTEVHEQTLTPILT